MTCKSIQPPQSILSRATFRCNYSCKSFGVCIYQLFAQSSLQNSSSSARLDGERLQTPIFMSCHRCSMGFRLGLWLDHSNSWLFFDLNHSTVALAVCLGSLSCWKVDLLPSLKSFAASNRISSRIALYLAPSVFPSTDQLPCPFPENVQGVWILLQATVAWYNVKQQHSK